MTQGYGDEFLKADAGKSIVAFRCAASRRSCVPQIHPLWRVRSKMHFRPLAAPLDLSDDDRAFISENLNYAGEPGLGIGGISEGTRVPGGARLRSFPSMIRERIPALDAYRYFVAENQIAIVDPTSAQVVAVMEGTR